MNPLFYDVFEALPRQGPGLTDSTLKALHLIPDLPEDPMILDIGCGNGTQTMDLLRALHGGRIVATDNHLPFVKMLSDRGRDFFETGRLTPIIADMAKLPFGERSFDLLWAEGSIFILGMTGGLKAFYPFLKQGGYFALTEIAWLKDNPPEKVVEFFAQDCNEVGTPDQYCAIAREKGYEVIDRFIVPANGWWDEYYTPMEKVIQEKRSTHTDPVDVDILDMLQLEIDICRECQEYYGYVFLVLKKV